MNLIDLNADIAYKDKVIKKCLDFITCNGGAAIANGKHIVEEDGIFLNVSEYTTRSIEDSKWEAHKQYIDFQLVLEGIEKIFVSDINKMKLGEYNPEKDYLPCDGETEVCYMLDKNTGILLMPEDAHMPGISVENKTSNVKKAVFKIPVK